jgi:hypothetical protein
MSLAFRNQITEHTSHSVVLVIDIVLYKALRHINQFTQWFSKHWRRGRGSHTSCWPSIPPLSHLQGQCVQMVLTLKVTLVAQYQTNPTFPVCRFHNLIIIFNVVWNFFFGNLCMDVGWDIERMCQFRLAALPEIHILPLTFKKVFMFVS